MNTLEYFPDLQQWPWERCYHTTDGSRQPLPNAPFQQGYAEEQPTLDWLITRRLKPPKNSATPTNLSIATKNTSKNSKQSKTPNKHQTCPKFHWYPEVQAQYLKGFS